MKLSLVWESVRPILARQGPAVATIALLLLFTGFLERPVAVGQEVPEAIDDPPQGPLVPHTPTPAPTATAVTNTSTARSDTAPDRAETQCLVSHAATTAQVCRGDDGAHRYYFIGPDGRLYSGPRLEAITTYGALYPEGYGTGEVEIYRGNNPGSGKEVVIHYLTASGLLRVATYYADAAYAVDKRYIFTIDEEGRVSHAAW